VCREAVEGVKEREQAEGEPRRGLITALSSLFGCGNAHVVKRAKKVGFHKIMQTAVPISVSMLKSSFETQAYVVSGYPIFFCLRTSSVNQSFSANDAAISWHNAVVVHDILSPIGLEWNLEDWAWCLTRERTCWTKYVTKSGLNSTLRPDLTILSSIDKVVKSSCAFSLPILNRNSFGGSD
jgi:hypothetical protein